YHRAVEASFERGPSAIGTTGRGIGFAYRDKAARTGLRVADLFDAAHFVAQVDRNLARLQLEYPEAAAELSAMSGATRPRALRDAATWLETLVTVAGARLHDCLRRGQAL